MSSSTHAKAQQNPSHTRQCCPRSGSPHQVRTGYHSVLLGEFSKADCRRVFPKVASKAYKRHFKSLLDAIDFISSSDCPLSDTDKQIHLQNKLDLLPALDAKDTTGLRLDALFENPITG